MDQAQSAERASARIRAALGQIREEMPSSANVIDAFGELLAEQASLKAELPDYQPATAETEFHEFSQGRPILGQEAFSVTWHWLKQAAPRLLPAMKHGFPELREQLSVIERFIENSEPETATSVSDRSLLSRQASAGLASNLGIDLEILQFVLNQMLKPLAAKKGEAMRSLIADRPWQKGYCPICGSWPEMDFLEGVEGRRWLRCSACGHEWAFSRMQCPFCESTKSDKLEIFYSEDRPFERAELCYDCMKYLVGIDLRAQGREVVREVAALGLVYLDVLAQERGFSPGAMCGWNQVRDD